MREFLSFIQPDEGLCELRLIKNGEVTQGYYRDRARAEQIADDYNATGWDAYYGVLPRIREGGKAEDVVTHSTVLWADIDAKAHMGDKKYALSHLVRYAITPSVIVDSGHGYHAYWKLNAPHLWDEVYPVLVGLAQQLRGDHVYDRPRILRIPGTTNYKDVPVPVRTIRFDTTRILRLADFHDARRVGLQALRPLVPRAHPISYEGEDDLPNWLQDLIDTGAPQGQRSEASFKVMCNLMRRGWTDDEIRGVFQVSPIGEKYREQRDGERWLIRSLTRARDQAWSD